MPRTKKEHFYYSEKQKVFRKRGTINGVPYEITAATEDALRAKIEEYRRRADLGLVLGDKTTFATLAKMWFQNRENAMTHNAKTTARTAINKHLAPVLGAKLVRDIRPEDIQAMMGNLSVSAKSTQSKILRTCRKIFDVAVDNNIILKNPAEKIVPGGDEAEEREALTLEQQEVLIKGTKGERIYIFVMLALYAGLRREEILGLQWDKVYLDAKAPYLEVRRACKYNEIAQGKVSSILKSEAAYRSIPIPSQLTEALKTEKAVSAGPFVCGGSKNWSVQQFRNAWAYIERRMCHEVVIDKETQKTKMLTVGEKLDKLHPYVVMLFDFHVTPHMLRHTYITQLCASGMDIKKIQYLAGHKSIEMTLKIYTHVVGNSPHELIDAIENAFRGSDRGSNKQET